MGRGNGYFDPPTANGADDYSDDNLVFDDININDHHNLPVHDHDDDNEANSDEDNDDMGVSNGFYGKGANSSRLTKRASQIVSDYRDYLAKTERSGKNFGDYGGNSRHNGYDRGEEDGALLDDSPQFSSGRGGAVERMRYDPEEAEEHFETIEDLDSPMWDDHDDRCDDNGKAYRHLSLWKRKLRVYVASGMTSVLLMAILISLTKYGRSSKPEGGKEIVALAVSDSPEKPTHPSSDENIPADLSNFPILSALPSKQKDTTTHSTTMQVSSSPEATAAAVQPSDDLAYADQKQIVDYYDPIWFSRSDGWEGKTHEEGVTFCSDQGDELFLCPYDAYCPNGPGQSPLLGARETEGEEQWAPITMPGQPWMKLWVGVGQTFTCLHNVDVVDLHPLTEEITQHVMCCSEPALEKAPSPSDSSSEEASNISETGDDPQNEDGGNETSDASGDDGDDGDSITYNPKWLRRKNGWNGHTFKEAEIYCKAILPNGDLCPYETLCPDGVGEQPYSVNIPEMTGEQWAPVKSPPNTWVRIDQDKHNPGDICQKHKSLHNTQAMFGLNGDQIEIKENILCCSIVQGGST